MKFLTRKQAAVIFVNFKNGTLDISESAVKFMYNDCTLNKNGNEPYIQDRDSVYEAIGDYERVIEMICNNKMEEANEFCKKYLHY